jgi:hypothetical protein
MRLSQKMEQLLEKKTETLADRRGDYKYVDALRKPASGY